jgi:hypothetical protein
MGKNFAVPNKRSAFTEGGYDPLIGGRFIWAESSSYFVGPPTPDMIVSAPEGHDPEDFGACHARIIPQAEPETK